MTANRLATCNLPKTSYGGQAIGASPAHYHLTMSPFSFQAVQTLNIEANDKPHIDVQNGKLVLTATRGNDQIRIVAPLNSVIPQIAATTVKKPKPKRRFKPFRSSENIRVGENSPLSKLKESDVREIRSLISDASYARTYSSRHAMMQELANVYNVHYTTVYSIAEGKTWRHVTV